jgi:hypothetical protein
LETLKARSGKDFSGRPIWKWLTFLGIVIALLAVDRGAQSAMEYMTGFRDREITVHGQGLCHGAKDGLLFAVSGVVLKRGI